MKNQLCFDGAKLESRHSTNRREVLRSSRSQFLSSIHTKVDRERYPRGLLQT